MLTRRTVLQTGGWAAGLALLGAPLVSVATPIVEIQMRGNADGSAVWFDPVGVLIEPGQTVRWINNDRGNSHTSTAYHPKNTGHPLRIPEAAEPWNSEYLLPDQAFEATVHSGRRLRLLLHPARASWHGWAHRCRLAAGRSPAVG